MGFLNKKMKNNITNHVSAIKTFLSAPELLNLTVAVYLGTVLQQFLEDIISEVIYPLLQIVLPETIYKNVDIKFYNTDINVGKIIKSTMSFFVAVIVCYYFVAMIKY